MFHILKNRFLYLLSLLVIITAACSTSKETVNDSGFTDTGIEARNITSELPDYSGSLSTLKGKGKAIVSEPGTTDRVTIYFSSNRDKSLVTVKNGIGIEGGKLLTDGDSLLVYNKIDKFARKISIKDGSLNRINNLASLNILDIINFTVDSSQVAQVFENEELYRLMLNSGARIFVDKGTGLIIQVEQPRSSNLPYSRIEYEAYSEIKGFMLPRRITIFSADKNSKVNLLVQSLDINPELEELEIELPKNTKVYYQ
ncbi:MAG: DUF4292 domain-containing protein [Candidatus Halalkalibacterium sp. M3_1C_030]